MAESPDRSTFPPPHHERQAAHTRANRSDRSREQARQRWQPLIPPNWPPPESAAPGPDPAAFRAERDRPPTGRATPPRSAPPPRADPGFQWPDPQRPVPRRPVPPERPVRERAPDASGWHWLLWLPIIVPLLPFLYNRASPHLAGLPFYYWGQLALALLSAGVLAIVHVATKVR